MSGRRTGRAVAGVDLAAGIDRLYALPLEEFIAARNELARDLKKDGEADAAAEVAALKKPTLVAWAVNQLAHTRRREVDLLLDAGKRLVDAQQASIAKGNRTELDTAQTSLRNAVRGLTEAAAGILGKRSSASTLAKVAETLRSAATGAEGRELLARGRLAEDLSETGWDIVATLTPAPAGRKTEGAVAGRSQDRERGGAPAPPRGHPQARGGPPGGGEARRRRSAQGGGRRGAARGRAHGSLCRRGRAHLRSAGARAPRAPAIARAQAEAARNTYGRRNVASAVAPVVVRWSPSEPNQGFSALYAFQSATTSCGQRVAACLIAAFVEW